MLGPEGFTTPSLEFGPRVGESYRIEMQPPEGDSFYLTGEFREVDPPARLAFTFIWEDPDPTTSRHRHSPTSDDRLRAPPVATAPQNRRRDGFWHRVMHLVVHRDHNRSLAEVRYPYRAIAATIRSWRARATVTSTPFMRIENTTVLPPASQ